MHDRPRSFAKLADIRVQVEAETERMVKLARMVGKRLRHRLITTADTRALPGEEWTETAKWYSRCVIELSRFLAAQPEQPADKSLTPSEYEQEIAEIVDEKLREMTPAERRDLIQRIEHEPGGVSTPAVLNPAPDRWNQQ